MGGGEIRCVYEQVNGRATRPKKERVLRRPHLGDLRLTSGVTARSDWLEEKVIVRRSSPLNLACQSHRVLERLLAQPIVTYSGHLFRHLQVRRSDFLMPVVCLTSFFLGDAPIQKGHLPARPTSTALTSSQPSESKCAQIRWLWTV